MPNAYDQGSLVRVDVTISDVVPLNPVDPDALFWALQPPGGVEVVYQFGAPGSPIIRDGRGLYHVVVDLTNPVGGGLWQGRWYSTGNGQAAAPWRAYATPRNVP